MEGGGAITDIEGREVEATGAAFGGERDEAVEERLLATAGAKSFESRFDNSPPACGRGRGRGFHVHGFGLDRPSPRSPPANGRGISVLFSAPAAPDVDGEEQEQPNHVDDMPVPGGRLDADMVPGQSDERR